MLIWSTMFWSTWAIGLLGVLLWALKTWADPHDDRVTGTLWRAFVCHSRSTAVAVIAHLAGCILLVEGPQAIGGATGIVGLDAPSRWLNPATSIASGYMAQSLIFQWLGSRLRRSGVDDSHPAPPAAPPGGTDGP